MPKRGGSRGAKKPSLTTLSRMTPTEQDFAATYQEANSGSDRVAVIILAAQLQNSMARRIIQELGEVDDQTIEHLYDRDAPLSSFYSTSILALAMGIIDQDTFEQVNIIRRIRNLFAHAPVHVTFKSELVSAESMKLNLNAQAISRHVRDTVGEERARYMATTLFIDVRLERQHSQEAARAARAAKARLRRRQRRKAHDPIA
jgi:hypothetical protein